MSNQTDQTRKAELKALSAIMGRLEIYRSDTIKAMNAAIIRKEMVEAIIHEVGMLMDEAEGHHD